MTKHPSIKNYAQEFKKTIDGFRHHRHIREVFVDWLEIAACAIHQEPYHLGLIPKDEEYEKMEAQYLAAVKKYSREELDTFGTLLGITKMALWDEKADFLGKLYMELEISNDRSGEFFTPFEVSLMMAKMILGDISSQIKEKGFITVAEPACGGGGMLLAAAQVIKEQGYNPREVMFFDATDISKPLADMAYLQTSILGLSGIVRHGNTLAAKEWSSRFTPVCRVFPARTHAFIEHIVSSQTEEQAEAQQSAMENVEEEAITSKITEKIEQEQPTTDDSEQLEEQALKRLSSEPDRENYVQGSLF